MGDRNRVVTQVVFITIITLQSARAKESAPYRTKVPAMETSRCSHPSIAWMGPQNHSHHDLKTLLAGHGLLLQDFDAEAISRTQLILIDCKCFSPEDIRRYLVTLPTANHPPAVALHGATTSSGHEHLISWPAVKGIFYRDESPALLPKGIRAILAGENWFPRRLMNEWMNRQRLSIAPPVHAIEIPELTERERQILRHINRASTNAQIARSLAISEHTVKTHLYNIFRKIAVRNRTQACNWVKANLPLVDGPACALSGN